MAERKADLEEEMSRFEQEISGHLPPPPRLSDSSTTLQPLKPSRPVPPPSSRADMSIPPPQKPQFSLQNFPLPPMPPMPPGMRLRHPFPPFHSNDMSVSVRMGEVSMRFGEFSGMLPGNLPPPPAPPQMALPPMPRLMVSAPMPPLMPMMPTASSSGGNNPALVIKPPTVPLDSYEPVSAGPSEVTFGEAGGDVTEESKKVGKGKKKLLRIAGGQVWEDSSLVDWDPNDFRLFIGDIGNEVTEEALLRAFSRYPSLQKIKVVRDKRTKKTKGFGFISFKDPQDYLKAMREMNGKYVGNRPIKLRKSTWRDRDIGVAKRKEKEKKKLGIR